MIQGGLGWYHHKRYVADKPTHRRWFTHVHLWFGRLLLFLALINMGLGMQLYGDAAGAQAGWYLITILIVSVYAFFYWHNFYRNKKHINDSFDPTPFEDPTDDDISTKDYEPYRPLTTAAAADNGTYRSDQYDPEMSGVNEYGQRVKHTKAPPPTMPAVNRPPAAAPATAAGRRYDLVPTPLIPGPYGSTEPLRTGGVVHIDPQIDPFLDQTPRPRTGLRTQTGPRPQTGRPRTGAPYTVAMVGNEETPVQTSPAVYNDAAYSTPAYNAPVYGNTGYATTTQNTGYNTAAHNSGYTTAPNTGYTATSDTGYTTAPNTGYGTAPSTPAYAIPG
jgi:hypothetical protein